MRTIVDLPDDQIKMLDAITKKENVSRAELVRRAVRDYIEKRQGDIDKGIDDYFGFLKETPDAFDGLDGVGYQNRTRSEWNQRDLDYSRWNMHDSAGSTFIKKEQDER